MPTSALRIRLERRRDGAIVLELQRADGTRTWQKRTGPAAEFFALHDLTHYAVETTLGIQRGFYGLVAEGWDLADFGTPWPRGPLPPDALPAEFIVGCFDTQRAAGERLTAEQCNRSAADYFASHGRPSPVRVTDDELDAIRALLATLTARWRALAADAALELAFPPASGIATPH
jgi:hypothetical protein